MHYLQLFHIVLQKIHWIKIGQWYNQNKGGVFMKKLFCILCALTMIFMLCSCKNATPQSNEYEKIKVEFNKESVDEFISLLKDLYPDEHINGYSIDENYCYNVTPKQVAEETNFKIFKFSNSAASFVMLDNEIYSVCEWLGGSGFVNAIPCDFDNDGNKDLLVASSWGSGLHHSIISIFNSVSKESSILYDSSTTDTPNVNLIVAQSTANIFTDNTETDESLYYSILSAKIDIDSVNFVQIAYTVDGIIGHIEVQNGTPVFVSYNKQK